MLDERIPMTSMAQLVHDEFLMERDRFVVCGTHGKTTTTSILSWIFEVASREDGQSKWKPSFLIGGVAENFGTSFHVQDGTRPFLLEGDEYDTAFFDKGPKFLHYFPDAAILTHVEFDHADIYVDLDAVKTAFKRMVNLIPRRGRLVAFDGSVNVTECATKAFCTVERYGFDEKLVLAGCEPAPRGWRNLMDAASRRHRVCAFAPADGRGAQRAERNSCGRARCRARHFCRLDHGGHWYFQER